MQSPPTPKPKFGSPKLKGNAIFAYSPGEPCTPTRPQWLQRCEEATLRCPFPCCFAVLPSSKNEDRLAVDFRGGDALWAVFDGHRSQSVSGHAAQTVPKFVWDYLHDYPGHTAACLRQALVDCHESARREELPGGSTAVVVAATLGMLWCCCAGDSRAVAGLRNGGVFRMSVDHTTKLEEEVDRIKASGARLEWGRVGGVLPMTRGLGNFDLEVHGFACLPQVSSLPRSQADFVVIASDGLWDVISDEACCDFVRGLGLSGGLSSAESLASHAQRLGSADDISVIVVYFPPEEACLPSQAGAAGA